jgi:hypothetical protein
MKTLFQFTLALAIALFTASVPAATRIWDGGGANGLWTNAANWSNNIAPANGDALVFPSGVTRLLTTNTPGGATNFSSFTLTGDDYVLVSSTLSLTNGLTCAGGGIFGGVNTLRAPVRLAAGSKSTAASSAAQPGIWSRAARAVWNSTAATTCSISCAWIVALWWSMAP